MSSFAAEALKLLRATSECSWSLAADMKLLAVRGGPLGYTRGYADNKNFGT